MKQEIIQQKTTFLNRFVVKMISIFGDRNP